MALWSRTAEEVCTYTHAPVHYPSVSSNIPRPRKHQRRPHPVLHLLLSFLRCNLTIPRYADASIVRTGEYGDQGDGAYSAGVCALLADILVLAPPSRLTASKPNIR